MTLTKDIILPESNACIAEVGKASTLKPTHSVVFSADVTVY